MVWPEGEAAFVTGAASGMGLGTARALVAAGAKVALADIDAARLEEVASELRQRGGTVSTVPLDVTDAEAWAAAADRAEQELGPISILAQFAGVSGAAPIDSLKLEVWRWVHRINVEAQFIGVSTFLPRFKAHGGRAHILNTASMAGIVPMQHVSAYSSSKFASVGFTMVLRDELQGTGIGVSLLCPGTVATRLNKTAEELQAKLEDREPDERVIEGNGAALSRGADPDRVGEQVVEAMQNGQFLIITHYEWLPLVKRVHKEIEDTFAAFDRRHGVDETAVFLVEGGNPITS